MLGQAKKGRGLPGRGTWVSFRVSDQTKKRLDALQKQGYDISLGLETAVAEWCRDLLMEEEEA